MRDAIKVVLYIYRENSIFYCWIIFIFVAAVVVAIIISPIIEDLNDFFFCLILLGPLDLFHLSSLFCVFTLR